MAVLLKQTTEQYADEILDSPVTGIVVPCDHQECRNVIDVTERERVDKAFSDIAKNLVSARRRESRVDNVISHLAKIFGGGLRTSW